jgi:hypothetical protein
VAPGTHASTAAYLQTCRLRCSTRAAEAGVAAAQLATSVSNCVLGHAAAAAESPLAFNGPALSIPASVAVAALGTTADSTLAASLAAPSLLPAVQALQDACLLAATTSAGAETGWAVDVGCALSPPASSCVSVDALRSFCRDRLKLSMTTDRILLGDCGHLDLRKAIREWYETHDVNPENIDTVSDAIIEAQLAARFPDQVSRVGWIRSHMIIPPAAAELCTVLREVMVFSEHLSHYMQVRRICTSGRWSCSSSVFSTQK